MKKLLIVASLILTLALAMSGCGGAPASADAETTATGASTAAPASSASTAAPASSASTAAPAATEAKAAAPQNISIVAREDGSGTKTAFMEIIGLKGKADPANVIIQTATASVLAEVAGNPAAIAYESLGYVTDEVKMLQVDGVEANVANIKDGTYKISRPLSIVYQEASLDDEVNGAFYSWLQSNDAQTIISEQGYVSVVDGAPDYTMNGALSGSIDVSGSTSLQPLMIELAAAFEAIQTNVTVNVSGGGSGTGYQNAEEGVSAFGMISEEFSLEKAPACTHYVVCKDGIAVIVNPENTHTGITMDQLKSIYDVDAGEGAITDWNALAE